MSTPWIVVTDYPRWPSPYFQQLAQALPTDFGLEFRPSLNEIARQPNRPGVVNLHRLARLYRDRDGHPNGDRAAALIERLDELRAGGWRLVWTVHNLLPIRAETSDPLDERVAAAVLDRTDALITHTASDAQALRAMCPDAVIVVGGSAGLDTIANEPAPAPIQALADQLARAHTGLLVLGNIAAYKGLPQITRAFLDATVDARLVIAGRPADPPTVALLEELSSRAGTRLVLHAQHVRPGNAQLLCQASTGLLCPYRADGPFAFFRRALHPSSVSMATGFATPVIAPDLPSIRELTDGHARALYASSEQAAEIFGQLDRGERPWNTRQRHSSPANRWPAIAEVYLRLATELTTAPTSAPLT